MLPSMGRPPLTDGGCPPPCHGEKPRGIKPGLQLQGPTQRPRPIPTGTNGVCQGTRHMAGLPTHLGKDSPCGSIPLKMRMQGRPSNSR